MQKTFKIKGMTCASCAHYIEKSIGKISGVESCGINFATETARVVFDDAVVSIDQMNNTIQPLGYELIDISISLSEDREDTPNKEKSEKLTEINDMRTNIITIIPFVVFSFIYMIWDIGGEK